MGTAVGTQVFLKYGWRPAAALSVAWSGFTIVVLLLRGPHCARYTWFGYEGGYDWRKRETSSPADAEMGEGKVAEQAEKTGSQGLVTMTTLTQTTSTLPAAVGQTAV